ncbi:hydroxymethylglutaryl-CoA synthase [Nocardiopsis quinghaiensis]|uniref:hydroxymethylglutaryl-CoA synthase n=1 Tax=Nocardiopsis quinghaiensis TaxID=464995 RepID=UPI00123B1C02|nr:hydroxymethylglutaryl-CoA synthase [Nocardiopsis quinghaiensis]
MAGIESYAVYVPSGRLVRAAIGETLGTPRGRGARPVASYDEDSTTLAVAAVRRAVVSARDIDGSLWFATSRPAYLEKSNAATVATAGGLPEGCAAYDVGGALRGGAGALRAGLAEGSAVVVASDLRYALPGSVDESEGADASAGFVVGPQAVAELVASVSITRELLERWREPGETRTHTWEDRFGAEEYVPLGQRALDDVLDRCEIKSEDLRKVVISTPHSRTGAALQKKFSAEQGDLGAVADLGYAGAADLGVGLVAAFEAAAPGDLVLAMSVVDGADAFVFRMTERHRPGGSGLETLGTSTAEISYADFLTWRGLLPREPARRPALKPPVPPASLRASGWKFGFVAGRCRECEYRNLPPRRVCLRCNARDSSEPEPMIDVPAYVATLTDDWLSESVQLPAKVAAVDFEGGGRFEFELADAAGRTVNPGDPVVPTFRVAGVADNKVRNYIWKVRPHREGGC